MIEQEIVTKLEDMDVGSYTVARVMKDEHFCVELHYDARQNYAWVEIMTRTAEDCWNGYDEDAPWFRTDMFDDEILMSCTRFTKSAFRR